MALSGAEIFLIWSLGFGIGSSLGIESILGRSDAKKNPRDGTKFWVVIMGLKNPIGNPYVSPA